jgi:hypothetical protein
MRRGILLSLWLILGASGAFAGENASVLKVLPHCLDLKGRNTLSPSLFERDAYQARLKKHPEERSGLRFDVQWRVKSHPVGPLKLKIETRSATTGQKTQSRTLEQTLTWKNGWSHWAAASITATDYDQFGELTAWRATLWDGETPVAESKSFLW